jgi:hypothetical protein
MLKNATQNISRQRFDWSESGLKKIENLTKSYVKLSPRDFIHYRVEYHFFQVPFWVFLF